jgi:hypothetical protein
MRPALIQHLCHDKQLSPSLVNLHAFRFRQVTT